MGVIGEDEKHDHGLKWVSHAKKTPGSRTDYPTTLLQLPHVSASYHKPKRACTSPVHPTTTTSADCATNLKEVNDPRSWVDEADAGRPKACMRTRGSMKVCVRTFKKDWWVASDGGEEG